MWRRSALSVALAGACLGAAAPAAAQGAGTGNDSAAIAQAIRPRPGDSLGRLEVPEAAGPAVKPVTARDNDPLVIALERKIRCTCGCNQDVYTCRTTDFSCTTSPAMHRLVLARLDSGMTSAQVLDAFQKQYGEAIFMAPPARGFNWAAYVMPFLGLGVGIGLVVGLVRRWVRVRPGDEAAAGAAPGAAGAGPAEISPEDLAKLKQELEKFEA